MLVIVRKTAVFITCFLVLAVSVIIAAEDIDRHRSCSQCGMDRKLYGYSRMLVTYEDGSSIGTCSIHCTITELGSRKGQPVKALLVADRNSRDLIPAEKAAWVVGGSKRGVMTSRAKWAFSSREAAEKFVLSYGGETVPWETALAAARTDADR